jgi:phosphoribosylglycinamide formyltransferase-1
MNFVAIFASGNGSNAEQVVRYFKNHPNVKVNLILSNRTDAYVLQRAKNLGVDSMIFSKRDLYETDKVLQMLKINKIGWIVLAGFLWKIPHVIIQDYRERIINIHPALLPDFGGKGMYGMHVHEAVIKSGKKISGITIHLVDEIYDNGKIIFQAQCDVEGSDTPESLANKIHKLEHEFFPKVIENLLR